MCTIGTVWFMMHSDAFFTFLGWLSHFCTVLASKVLHAKMKQRAVQISAITMVISGLQQLHWSVDTRVRNYELLSYIKPHVVKKRGHGSEGAWHKYINVPSGPQILARTLTGMTFLSALQLRSIK